MNSNGARIAECLERHHIRCMASLIRELARRRRRREQERQLGHPVPAGHHHELDEPGIDADMLVPLQGQHVCLGCLINLGGGLSLRAC